VINPDASGYVRRTQVTSCSWSGGSSSGQESFGAVLRCAKASADTWAHKLCPYTTPGTGSIQHLSMELLAYLSGTKFVHVPYRSGALALNDTLAGHVPLSVLQALPQLESRSEWVRPQGFIDAAVLMVLRERRSRPSCGATCRSGRAHSAGCAVRTTPVAAPGSGGLLASRPAQNLRNIIQMNDATSWRAS
jgi:hypothetical protein